MFLYKILILVFRGSIFLWVLSGIACFAFLCGGFWVLKYGTRRRREKVFPVFTHPKHGIDTDTYVEEREDRISQLPDDVISLIVSRLYTSDAVRTSVLSRRWKHVYTFISEVTFSCYLMTCDTSPCYKREGEKLNEFQRKFVQVVDTFLHHHSGSRIMSFELVCCFRGCILDSFRRWMNSVGRLGVERLTLRYCCRSHVLKSYPPLFSFDFLPEASSVKRLCLMGGSFQISSQNALKDLELYDVAFTSEALDCILLNCCSLQSLTLKRCVLPSKLRIHGPDLQLKNLAVCLCSKVAEIDLSATKLATFKLSHFRIPPAMVEFSNVPLLQNLFVETNYRGLVPYVFKKVAKDLPHLKCMCFWTEARLFEAFEIGGFNKLSNLRQLALLLMYYNKLDLLALAATILDACPLLHKFHLSMRLPSTFNGKRAEKRVVRHHTQLKEVKFSGFSGTENEYNFISYILKNVVSLERLSIFVDYIFYEVDLGRWVVMDRYPKDDKKRRIIRKRLQGQAISKNAEIIIIV